MNKAERAIHSDFRHTVEVGRGRNDELVERFSEKTMTGYCDMNFTGGQMLLAEILRKWYGKCGEERGMCQVPREQS